jgi:flagellar hook-basal body complex protein FliE
MAIQDISGLRTGAIEGPARIQGPSVERPGGPGAPGAAGATSFAGELGRAIGALDGLQVAADAQVEQVASGSGNLHEMAIALEKADVGMRIATKVRNKLIEAYQEIMRMSV